MGAAPRTTEPDFEMEMNVRPEVEEMWKNPSPDMGEGFFG